MDDAAWEDQKHFTDTHTVMKKEKRCYKSDNQVLLCAEKQKAHSKSAFLLMPHKSGAEVKDLKQ